MSDGAYYVYVHQKPNGTPFYVGKGHGRRCFDLKNNRNKRFLNTVSKYGSANIAITQYPCDDEQNAFDLEIIIIGLFRNAGFPLTNLTDGGEGASGYVFTPEDRQRMSKAQLGKKLPAEQRAKMSASRRGRKFSAETRTKISQALTGKKKSVAHVQKMAAFRKGKPLSKAHREAISAALKGRAITEEHRAKISASRRKKI